jgi:hypothetical protein
LIKIDNLDLARAHHPALRAVDTFNADSNPYVVGINELMGFRPHDRWVSGGSTCDPRIGRVGGGHGG